MSEETNNTPAAADLQKENEQLKEQLKEAHEAISEAEKKAPEAPVFTANVLDEDGKKTKDKVKVRLTIPESKYPVSSKNYKLVNAEALKKDQDLVNTLYAGGFGGFEVIVKPKKD